MNDAERRTRGARWRLTPKGQVTAQSDRGVGCRRDVERPTTCWEGLPLPEAVDVRCAHEPGRHDVSFTTP